MSEERVPYIAGPQKPEEERIAIIKWNTKHDICPAPTGLQCGGVKSCENCKVGMTRQEAIDRMAKAMCSHYGINRCENCGFSNEKLLCKANCEAHYEVAEATLNALLEKAK